MYKMPTHRMIWILPLLSIFVVSVFSYITFFLQEAKAKNITLFDFSEYIEDKFYDMKENDALDAIAGKKVTVNLFDTSINLINTQTIKNTKKTLTETVALINTKYLCDMEENEVGTVLYLSNPSFRYTTENIILWGRDIEKDVLHSDVKNACKKLLLCMDPKIKDIEQYRVSTDAISVCSKEINRRYQSISINNKGIETIHEYTYGKELFRNNELEDSSYDIMTDIYQVNRLLFEYEQKPSEIVFYQMPQLPLPALENTSTPNFTRNWFNPHWEDDQKNKENIRKKLKNQKTYTKKLQFLANEKIIRPHTDDMIRSHSHTDDTIQTTTEQLSLSDTTSTSMWNICGESDTTDTIYTPLSQHTPTVLPEYETLTDIQKDKITKDIIQYTDTLDKKLVQNSCNDNGICESYEHTTCKDCKTTNKATNNHNTLPDPENMDIGEDLWLVKSCIKDCGKYSDVSDKFLCVLQCTCKTYESKIWEDVPWLGKVFRVKFCMVPPEPNKTPKNIRVYSIESIITYIRDTLRALKDSGQLNLQNITKEAIDTSNSNLDIWWQATFTFSMSSKETTREESQYTRKQKAEQAVNKIYFETFGVSWNPKDDREKNKYAIMVDLPAIQAKERWFNSVHEKYQIQEMYQPIHPSIDIDMVQVQSIQELNRHKLEQMQYFLDQNIKFRYDSNTSFKAFSSGIEAMLKK